MTEWWLIGAGVLLTLGTGVAVAAEFSLVTVERSTVEQAAEAGDRRARRVLRGLRTLSTQLSGAQVAISFTTLLVGYLVEPSLARLLRGPFDRVGTPEPLADTLTVGLAMLAATMFSMLVGELIPKNLAVASPLATAKWSAPLQQAFTFATAPLIKALNGTANACLKLFGIEPQEELSSGRSPEELAALVRHSARAGTLDPQTATRVRRTLTIDRLTAADVMVHRLRVQLLAQDATAADVIALTRRTGLSRFPVTGEGADDVIGVVHVKHAVGVPPARRSDVRVTELMTDIPRVPDSLPLSRLLVVLKQQGVPLAMVQDEYGGTAGVVSLEDVVEEVVGDVADEHDRPSVEAVRQPDGSWLLAATLRPDEVRTRTGIEVPDDTDYDTVAGFVVARLGRLAEPGDTVPVPGGELVVDQLDGRHIDRIRYRPADDAAAEPHS